MKRVFLILGSLFFVSSIGFGQVGETRSITGRPADTGPHVDGLHDGHRKQ